MKSMLKYKNGEVALYNYYNNRFVGWGGCCGTLTTGSTTTGSGTFLVFEICDSDGEDRDGEKAQKGV